MTKEDRRKCINWMLNQIDAIENARDDMVLSDGTELHQCGISNYIHVYGDGFYKLADAVDVEYDRADFSETQWKDSFMFAGTEFMKLTDKSYLEDEDEEPAE